LASPIVAPEKIARLIDLVLAGCKIMVVVDDHANVADFAAAAQSRHATVDLLVDVDAGRDKLGVRDPSEAVALAQQIVRHPNLRFRGIQVYGGHVQHIYDFHERQTAAHQVHARARAATAALTAATLPPEIVTGGGTGSFQFDLEGGPFNDLQIGSYAFMDVDYLRVDFGPSGPWPFTSSLHVLATVISRHVAGRVTTDAGIKSFATDGPPPQIVKGCPAGSNYAIAGDEHGRVTLPSGAAVPPLGQRVLCVVPHCDPNVNLYDFLHVCRGDQLVELWPIDARGRSI
jgi:D-serine deaminase-like pyridoxal phosphate-dependent protein